ncbi:hypothetical protein BOTBODRAFT_232897 [Botryobasidium botryosum FD-172 SS1]|uniref:NAD-dependent epimerase/dehydratase domain-containing protein n=1 Tax=Botryobasidium botryosum (strain FD-172 SS1) TaxID=930990 RepID=A0A067M5Q6_BOTB1|nr:hypothetical protein BOTBODRAFT_232897 [Botryobasidium botryosum FD-172 SS1]
MMHTIQAPATVLVTGASGYLAASIVKELLDRGYSVRGTVRSAAKGDYLKNLFKAHEPRFQYVIVPDMSNAGAYDDAVVGVDAVAHTASPTTMAARDPQDVIKPAVAGTVNILESVKKYGPSVKRVVITGSCGAIVQPKSGDPVVYTEADWNDHAVDEVQAKGVNVDSVQSYHASKVLAERAAWNWVEEHKGETSFDIVTILPAFVLGPLLNEAKSPSQLNESSQLFYYKTKTEAPPNAATAFFANVVDVRDVAFMHAQAFEIEKAGGERFIAAVAPSSWQTIYDALNSANPPLANIPKGTPGAPISNCAIFVSKKAQDILGVKFRSLQETAVDMVNDLREKEAQWSA